MEPRWILNSLSSYLPPPPVLPLSHVSLSLASDLTSVLFNSLFHCQCGELSYVCPLQTIRWNPHVQQLRLWICKQGTHGGDLDSIIRWGCSPMWLVAYTKGKCVDTASHAQMDGHMERQSIMGGWRTGVMSPKSSSTGHCQQNTRQQRKAGMLVQIDRAWPRPSW